LFQLPPNCVRQRMQSQIQPNVSPLQQTDTILTLHRRQFREKQRVERELARVRQEIDHYNSIDRMYQHDRKHPFGKTFVVIPRSSKRNSKQDEAKQDFCSETPPRRGSAPIQDNHPFGKTFVVIPTSSKRSSKQDVAKHDFSSETPPRRASAPIQGRAPKRSSLLLKDNRDLSFLNSSLSSLHYSGKSSFSFATRQKRRSASVVYPTHTDKDSSPPERRRSVALITVTQKRDSGKELICKLNNKLGLDW